LSTPLESAHGLLARARDDLFVVNKLAQEPDAPSWVIGFHTEQAVEKALKAVLTAASIAYPRTHNLVMLVELLRRAQRTVPADANDFSRLIPYGVVLRYDDLPGEAPPDVPPEWFIAVAQNTLAWAQTQISTQN